MAKKSEVNIFDRAYAALEQGTADEIGAVMKDLRALEEAERADYEATRPPQQVTRYGEAGVPMGTDSVPGGERYQRAARSDDTGALAKVTAEHDRLHARQVESVALRHKLQERYKIVAESEKEAAAPAKAKKLVGEIEKTLDVLEAAVEEYTAARAKVEALQRDLLAQREILGPDNDTGTLDLLTFRRLGEALAHDMKRHIAQTSTIMGEDTTRPHLFSSHSEALSRAQKLLPPPSQSILKQIKDKLAQMGGDDTHRELLAFQRERLNLITRGDLDSAEKVKVAKPKGTYVPYGNYV